MGLRIAWELKDCMLECIDGIVGPPLRHVYLGEQMPCRGIVGIAIKGLLGGFKGKLEVFLFQIESGNVVLGIFRCLIELVCQCLFEVRFGLVIYLPWLEKMVPLRLYASPLRPGCSISSLSPNAIASSAFSRAWSNLPDFQ